MDRRHWRLAVVSATGRRGGFLTHNPEEDEPIGEYEEQDLAMNKQTDKLEIKVTRYPEGVRFGAGSDVIMSSEVLETHYISRDEVMEKLPCLQKTGGWNGKPGNNNLAWNSGYNRAINDMRQALTTDTHTCPDCKGLYHGYAEICPKRITNEEE